MKNKPFLPTVHRQSRAQVIQFARNATLAGLDGIVCSGQELEVLSSRPELALDFVVPGVRPGWAVAKDDQSRTVTPGEAIKKGAGKVVIGRPILDPPVEIGSREEAARRISHEIDLATRGITVTN